VHFSWSKNMIDFQIFAITNTSLQNIDMTMASDIAKKLQPFSWLIATTGFALMLSNAWGDPKAILVSLVIAMGTVSFMANYPAIMSDFQVYFKNIGKGIESDFSSFNDLWNKDISGDQDTGGLFKSVQNAFFFVIYKLLQSLGFVGRSILVWVQPFVVNCLIAVSPITIALFLIPFTQQIGTNFLMTSLGVCLWPIGTALADLFVAKIGTLVFTLMGIASAGAVGVVGPTAEAAAAAAEAGAIGTAASAAWPVIIGAFLVMAVFLNVLYLAVPLSIGKILSGASPAFAAAGAVAFMAAQAVPLARGMGQLTSAIKGLSNRLGGSTSSPVSSNAGGSSSSSESSSSLSPHQGGFPSASSGSPTPPPDPISPRGGGSGGGALKLGGGRGTPSALPDPGIPMGEGVTLFPSESDRLADYRKMKLAQHAVKLDEKYQLN
jgi:hypothetical protein